MGAPGAASEPTSGGPRRVGHGGQPAVMQPGSKWNQNLYHRFRLHYCAGTAVLLAHRSDDAGNESSSARAHSGLEPGLAVPSSSAGVNSAVHFLYGCLQISAHQIVHSLMHVLFSSDSIPLPTWSSCRCCRFWRRLPRLTAPLLGLGNARLC